MTESGSRVGVFSVVSEKDSENDCVSEKEYVTKEHFGVFHERKVGNVYLICKQRL